MRAPDGPSTWPTSGFAEIGKEAIARIDVIYNADGILKTRHRENEMAGPARSGQSSQANLLVASLGRLQGKGRTWPRKYRFAGC